MPLVQGVLTVFLSLLCVSCLAPQNTAMVAVDMRGWSEPATILFENEDTLSLRSLDISIRYNREFAESKLPLKLKVLSPDGRFFEESLTFTLKRPYRASVVSVSESVPYRADVTLAMKGTYIVVFEPHSEIEGVEAIGVEIK